MAAVELRTDPLDAAEELAQFNAALADVGAVVSFAGLARGRSATGEALEALVLESYRGVTLASMEAIAADAAKRFPILDFVVRHRVGAIVPGETIVFVAAAATHRRAAFDAADYLMDRLKTEAVFWKREQGSRSSAWIEPRDEDFRDRIRWDE